MKEIHGGLRYFKGMNITVVGAGNMGGALAKGWSSVFTPPSTITITARTQATLERFTTYKNIVTSLNNCQSVLDASIIIVAVKPWLVEQVCAEISPVLKPNQILCSVAAGISTERLSTLVNSSRHSSPPISNIFYVMPNIAAEFCSSMTFIAPAKTCTPDSIAAVEKLFTQVGSVKICDESLIPTGMMLGGCGIAYVMRFLRAEMEAGVEMGFKPKEALEVAMQTMEGAVKLLRATGEHPEAAIDRVTTPGGITIKGLNELEHAGFTSAVIRCLKAGLK